VIGGGALDEIGRWLVERWSDPRVEAALRARYPALHFTFCSDDEICGPAAAHEESAFKLYLVDGSGHCLALTNDPAAATGLVVAAREDA
jgi:hypothetical protein